ncbi:hypothetical protein CYMTET_35381 [Cymbomonas tetramitiformis]|uniref:Uncharacterized protein n=1 Tax=Cymbomonas tetramitiformis TaxID=36881 RepID=A0AAE0F9F0_9CHLO|nr:hypothetical protein CYMTET_35381 [Cymbomonas tetramitiformis]
MMQNVNTGRSPPTSPTSTRRRSWGRQPSQRSLRDSAAAGEPTGKGSKGTYKSPSHGQPQNEGSDLCRAEYDGDTKASYRRAYVFVWPNEPASRTRHESSPASSEELAAEPRSESTTSSTEEPIFCIQNEYSAHLVGGDCDGLPSRTAANTFP